MRLKTLRKELDLTQQELSDRIGVSRAYIADVEAGRKEPSRNFILKMSERMQISGDWLLSGAGEMFLDGAVGTVRDRLVSILAVTDRDVDGWFQMLQVEHKGFGELSIESGLWDPFLLTRVKRLEGLREEWLLRGEGTPFSGGRVRSDSEALARLEQLLATAAGWHIYLVTDRELFCVVLIAPGWSDPEEEPSYEYTILEVIGGAVGRRTLGAVRGLLGRYALYVLVISADGLQRLVNGRMGIREFVGRGRTHAPLDGAVKIELAAQMDEWIPESVDRIDLLELEKVCGQAAEDPRSARVLYWLSSWLPRATAEERIYLEGLLRRNFPEY
ncbi:MAG: helix-turn-helix transcriptional regulator [Magnetococcales bacterium]|nr:helix-turn-helix transcriptional regulator [Magnetococcales bacterium]NGZ06509.1 helix-turn-helix transcriptional regulator [Magnetococcales bacterium]